PIAPAQGRAGRGRTGGASPERLTTCHRSAWLDVPSERAVPVEIRTFHPTMADQWFGFMDGAFADNPAWAGCYCAFYDHTGPTWDTDEPGSATRNRATRRGTIETGRATGLLAIED